MSSGGAELRLRPARDGTLGRLMSTRTRQRRLRKRTREMEERIARLGPPPVGVSAQPGKCIYTCARDATTDDDIPPKGLLGGLPGPRLTVPSCQPCNGGSSKDDAYFIQRVAPNIESGGHSAARAVWEKHHRGLQDPRAARFKRALFADLARLTVVDAMPLEPLRAPIPSNP